MSQWLQFLLTFISSGVLALGSWLTYKASVRGKRIESETPAYPELTQRVGTLERQVSALFSQLHLERDYTLRVMRSLQEAGIEPPEPRPGWLLAWPAALNTSIFEEPYGD